MLPRSANNTLVALIPSVADFGIVQDEHWYRIPRRNKNPPRVLTEGRLQFLSFYHPKAFGKEWQYTIRYVAEVRSVSIVKRKDLLPPPEGEGTKAYLQWLQKAEEEYYKLELGPLQELPQPIYSRKWRRIVFIETTDRRLFGATEINDLFYGNALEERLYEALKEARIPVERQFHVQIQRQHCFLDFAIFCKKGKINVECDGGYHNYMPVVDEDRGRNNLLQSEGWSVLRFSEEDVRYSLGKNMSLVQETIGRCGGTQEWVRS